MFGSEPIGVEDVEKYSTYSENPPYSLPVSTATFRAPYDQPQVIFLSENPINPFTPKFKKYILPTCWRKNL